MHFDIHANGKSYRDKNLIKYYYDKRALPASGFQEIFFLSENPNELCNSIRLIIQEKQCGNDSNRFDSEIYAIIDEFLKYKYITPTEHKNLLKV